MRLLHTSDWHVGKTIRGHSRADEHQAVLSEIVELTVANEVDVVLVAGDLFESVSPAPEAERLVYRTLLELAGTGAVVVVIAGNHDHARRLDAVAPVFEAGTSSGGGVHVVARPYPPADGGVRPIETRDGEQLQVACLPFISQRGIVSAADLMTNAAYQNTQAFQERMAGLIGVLCDGFSPDSVNVLMAHAFVVGGELGGGERSAHVIDDYAVSAQIFPVTASYVALGHIHRPQRIAGAAPLHYCGSPLQLDFGEKAAPKQVNLVEVRAGAPAAVTALPLRGGRRLLTVHGTLADLTDRHQAGDIDPDAWLRVQLDEAGRPGLVDEVRDLFGERAVDVRSLPTTGGGAVRSRAQRRGRSPHELFAEFLAERGIVDERLNRRFAALLDAELGGTDDADPPMPPAGDQLELL